MKGFARAALIAAVAMMAGPSLAGGRVALVIGNTAYQRLAPLSNPASDAERMAELLAARGFDVMSCDGVRPGCFDLDRSDMSDAIEDFGDRADGADVALFFYAGHGMQTGDGNVLAPVNMELSCETMQARRATVLEDVLKEMEGAKEKIVLLDACRNDPLGAQQCAARGAKSLSFGSFAVPNTVTRFLLMSSTLNGQVAQDGPSGGHSPFAESLFHWMEREPAVPFDQMLDRVAKRVIERTTADNFTQIPEVLIRGGAPETCLVGRGCAGAAAAAQTRVEVEKLSAERARNQEYEQIVVALLENAGYADPHALSDDERRKFFNGLMATAAALGARGDREATVAYAALTEGDVGPARSLLESDIGNRSGDPLVKAASARHLAAIVRPTDVAAAAGYYREASELDPSDIQTFIDLAETSLAAGDHAAAAAAYERASALARSGAGTAEQRVWATEGRADMEWDSGRPDAALALYREANAAARRAAEERPEVPGLRRGILVTHYNIGHLHMDAGRTVEALAEFRAGLAVAEALAAEEPLDPRWQFDVGRGHERLGRALQRSGDLDGALREYERKHAIMTAVAARFPGDATWQRDLALADEFLADVAVARGDNAKAAEHYRASLERMIPVRDADPGNAGNRRFTSVTHLALGDALYATGDTEGALDNYRAATAISEALVAIDPRSGQWQWDLFRAYQRMATAQPPGAEWHEKALATLEAMKAAGILDPGNEKWIGITRDRLAQARKAG